MPLLYGDSSPSTLEIDYIDYLRRALAMAVEILLAEDQLVDAARRRRALQGRTADLSARLEALRATARQAVGAVARSPEDDPVTHCANHIEGAIDEAVARAGAEVQAQEAAAAGEIGRRERKAHAACLAAADAFLRRHDLPDAAVELDLAHGEGGYSAVLHGVTPYEVDSQVELAVDGSPFAAAEVRAGNLVRDGGSRSKEVRLAGIKLERLLLVRARRSAAELAIELRAGREARAEGLDLTVDRIAGGLRLSRIDRNGAEAIESPADGDRALAPLIAAIDAAIDGLAGQRSRLRGLRIDETPLEEHEHPSVLVDRLLAAMAPEVRRITERSLAPGELILRRQLGDGRREEIFVTHGALAEVVAQLPMARRRHFDVLGIPGVGTGGRAPTGEVDIDMIVDSAEVSAPSISVEFDDPAAGDAGEPSPT